MQVNNKQLLFFFPLLFLDLRSRLVSRHGSPMISECKAGFFSRTKKKKKKNGGFFCFISGSLRVIIRYKHAVDVSIEHEASFTGIKSRFSSAKIRERIKKKENKTEREKEANFGKKFVRLRSVASKRHSARVALN